MIPSISNIAWSVEQDNEVAQILNQTGIKRIDVAPSKYFSNIDIVTLDDAYNLKQKWLNHGISIVGMQSLLYGSSLNMFNPLHHDDLLNRLRRICRIGNWLGATRLTFGSPKNRNRAHLNDADAEIIALNFFSRLGIIARENGVIICLEPNPSAYDCNFMTTTAEAAKIVRTIDHPCIKLQYDLGSCILNNEDPIGIAEDYKDLIGHIHISEPFLKPLSNRIMTFSALNSHFECARIMTIEMAVQGNLSDIRHASEMISRLNYNTQ